MRKKRSNIDLYSLGFPDFFFLGGGGVESDWGGGNKLLW